MASSTYYPLDSFCSVFMLERKLVMKRNFQQNLTKKPPLPPSEDDCCKVAVRFGVGGTGLTPMVNAALTVPANPARVGADQLVFAQVVRNVLVTCSAALAALRLLHLRVAVAIVVPTFGVGWTGLMPTANAALTVPANPARVGVDQLVFAQAAKSVSVTWDAVTVLVAALAAATMPLLLRLEQVEQELFCTADLAVALTTMMSPAEHATELSRTQKTKDILRAHPTIRRFIKRFRIMVPITL